MSLSTTISHVIFGLPPPLLPSTVISILFFTQSFPSFLNTCPIHLSLLRLITSLIFSMHILSLSSASVFFSLSDTPHIHLTILISALSSFASCSAFTAIKISVENSNYSNRIASSTCLDLWNLSLGSIQKITTQFSIQKENCSRSCPPQKCSFIYCSHVSIEEDIKFLEHTAVACKKEIKQKKNNKFRSSQKVITFWPGDRSMYSVNDLV